MTVNMVDLTELIRDFDRAGQMAPGAVDRVLIDAGDRIMSTAQMLAPRRTGRLQASITVTYSPGKVVVGPHVPYGVYQEYGTGTRGEFPTGMYTIKPKKGGQTKALRFMAGGQVIYTRKVRHPGVKPHPYMRPAALLYADSLGADAAKVGLDLIMGRTV